MNMKHPAIISIGAFLAVWGTTSNFSLDYRAILGAVVLAMLISLATRAPFKVDVVRDRGALARIVSGGKIEITCGIFFVISG